jgi:hypothetical protein
VQNLRFGNNGTFQQVMQALQHSALRRVSQRSGILYFVQRETGLFEGGCNSGVSRSAHPKTLGVENRWRGSREDICAIGFDLACKYFRYFRLIQTFFAATSRLKCSKERS